MTIITGYKRRPTNRVNVGGIPMGSDFPIRIQSMTNTRTDDVEGTVEQCIRISKAGADYVRVTVPSANDVIALAEIRKRLRKRGFTIPVIADVHFNASLALQVADHVDKVRINPGNYKEVDKFITLIEKCRENKVALRIGVNHGSLSERIMNRYGDTPEGMAESAMEFLRICQQHNFDQVVVSMKASHVRVMVYSTRLLVKMMHDEGMSYPIHVGVTEAGDGEDGRIKSAAGIGTLLAEGLGDTIRVSLTEEPENEIPVARKLVEHLNDYRQDPSPLHILPPFPGDPYSFNLRRTRASGNTGGNHPPVVIGSDRLDEKINMREASLDDVTDTFIAELHRDRNALLVYRLTGTAFQAQLRWLHARLTEQQCDVPVIFRIHLHERNVEDFMLKSAAILGGSFIDGFGNGIWLSNQYPLPDGAIISTAFGILQACRARMSKTEYISCPSCGRTHFSLMETLARIKAATSHLKGLKIGVMGCIVNGPGEMADADYGYVGAGKGKITLYRSREVVKKGIPEESAVDELVRLIKDNGDWMEP